MSWAIDKLLSIAGPPICPPIESWTDAGDTLSCDLVNSVLKRINGFYAFESALHLFPLVGDAGAFGIDSWNADNLWRSYYGDMAEGFRFFAEDVFGGQFGIKNDVIYSFDPETGEASRFAQSVDEWARKLLGDYESVTGFPLAHRWQVEHGALLIGDRLVPRRPFVLGGEFSIQNVVALEAVKGMRFRGSIAVQIRDLPDGASISIRVVD